ncbi:MAG: S8 family serine peptidase [PVC group bacterium]
MKHMGYSLRLIFSLMLAGITLFFFSQTTLAVDTGDSIIEGLFFYSCGKKVELSFSTEAIAVKFYDSVPLRSRQAILSRMGGTAYVSGRKEKPVRGRVERLRLKEGISVNSCLQALRTLNALPEVEYATPLLIPVGSEKPITLTNEFIARFKAKTRASEIEEINAANRVKIVREYPHNQYLLSVNIRSGLESLYTANEYCIHGKVNWAEPNYIPAVVYHYDPVDEYFDEQWHLKNTGQGGGTPGVDINADAAWDVTAGSSGIVVAVFDEGIEIDHEDLAANVAGGKNFGAGDANDPRPQPGNPIDGIHTEIHGTPCAGLAVAVSDNVYGVAGVAYGCRLLALRKDGSSTNQDLADGFTYAAANADVMSNSWGMVASTVPQVIVNAINSAATNGRGGKGLPIFFSVGNENVDLDGLKLLVSLDSVISVGACDYLNERASYSNYCSFLDIVAPSSGQSGNSNKITTTDCIAPNGYNGSGDYCHADKSNGFGGTSAACPQVAGVAALILSQNPNLTAQEVKNIICNSCDYISDPEGDGSNYNNGNLHPWNRYSGYGRINAYKAVAHMDTSAPSPKDTDGDGVEDWQEIEDGTDPLDQYSVDSDHDGWSNWEENWYGSDPDDPMNWPEDPSEFDIGVEDDGSDSDGDGITDYDEVHNTHTNPRNADTDGDGAEDGQEIQCDTDPLDSTNYDSDCDGWSDWMENWYGSDPDDPMDWPEEPYEFGIGEYDDGSDSDGDKISDYDEVHNTLTNPLNADTDGDGAEDGQEIQYGTDPLDPADGDSDHDGWSNFMENLCGSDPNNPMDWPEDPSEFDIGVEDDGTDSDGDGITDYDEVHNTLTNPLNADTEGDGLNDGVELQLNTDPLKPDTDSDGLNDYQECQGGTDPLNPDTDGDGLNDGDEMATRTDPNDADSDNDGYTDGVEVAAGSNPNSAGSVPSSGASGDEDLDSDGIPDNPADEASSSSTNNKTLKAKPKLELKAKATSKPTAKPARR